MSAGVLTVALFLFGFLPSPWHISHVHSRVVLLFESSWCTKGVVPLHVMNTDMMWKLPFITSWTLKWLDLSRFSQTIYNFSGLSATHSQVLITCKRSHPLHVTHTCVWGLFLLHITSSKVTGAENSYLSININLNYNLLSYWNKGVHTKFINNIKMWQQSNAQQLTFEWLKADFLTNKMQTLIVPTQELLGKTLAQ